MANVKVGSGSSTQCEGTAALPNTISPEDRRRLTEIRTFIDGLGTTKTTDADLQRFKANLRAVSHDALGALEKQCPELLSLMGHP